MPTSLPTTSPVSRAQPALSALIAALCLLLGCDSRGAATANASTQTMGAGSSLEATGGLVIQNPASERAYFYDFGSIPNGTTASHTFELKNTDDVPIVIQDMTPSCSCTMPVISYVNEQGETIRGRNYQRPVISIPPGVTAKVKISVDTNHVRRKNLDKLSSVHLRCDSVGRPYVTFEMHLIALEAYQATPTSLNMGDVAVSSGARSSTTVINAVRGGGYRLLEVISATDGLAANVTSEYSFGQTIWTVEAELLPPLEKGVWTGEIVVGSSLADGEGEGPPLTLKVRANVISDVVMFPSVLSFFISRDAGVPPLAKGVVTALAAGHRIKIIDAILQGDLPKGIKLEYEPQAPDSEGRSGRWNVTLTAPLDMDVPAFVGRVQLTLDDPTAEVIEARFAYSQAH